MSNCNDSVSIPPFIERLFISIEKLKEAVARARHNLTLLEDDSPLDKIAMSEHFDKYHEILAKQENYGFSLIEAVKNQDLDSIRRFCQLINGMSIMIRDDVKQIAKILNDEELEVREMM